jgi:hypothetical protein
VVSRAWYASWDLAFHCITLALVDPEFAKNQLILLMREWYVHPNGTGWTALVAKLLEQTGGR